MNACTQTPETPRHTPRTPVRARIAVAAVLGLACSAVAVVAAVLPSAASAEECPNAVYRTGPSAHLPDCRAYEMVTPPFKDLGFPPLPASIGAEGQLEYDEAGAFNGAENYLDLVGFVPGVIYTGRRTSSGWVSMPQPPSATQYVPAQLGGLKTAWAADAGPGAAVGTIWTERPVGAPENSLSYFLRMLDGAVVEIGPILPPTAPDNPDPTALGNSTGAQVSTDGTSSDGSRLFFTMRVGRWPFDSTGVGAPSLYEYAGTGNTTPMLVGVDNSGKLVSECGINLGGSNETDGTDSDHNAISSDGNTVFFTADPPGGTGSSSNPTCTASGPPVKELFARIDNGLPDAHTVAISEPSEEDCRACYENGVLASAAQLAGAHFEGASADGSKVFFTTTQPLLGHDTSLNLYEYDFDAPAGEKLTRVSAGEATAPGARAEVVQIDQGSPANSEDGSHVYFIANGLLTAAPSGTGETAVAGANNLYVFERDTQFPAGRIAFVARLSEHDLSRLTSNEGYRWHPEATPDGNFLVFASARDLTADDTSTARQIFEYDAQTESLTRVSIGQNGFNHNGNVEAKMSNPAEAYNDASIHSEVLTTSVFNRIVSDNGAYVFFQSIVGLTPEAFNQKSLGYDEEGSPVYANNVYEYHAGRVSLISDGQDVTFVNHASNVELYGADASGTDVFFATADRLVGQDTDTNIDIYDARIDGGFPSPVAPAQCAGEACQGTLSGAPSLLSPGSEFQAGGNPPLAAEASTTSKGIAKNKAKGKPKSRHRRKTKKPRDGRARGARLVKVGERGSGKAGR